MNLPQTVIILLASSALTAFSETARWPMRIVETSYTVHLLTGTTTNERSKEKNSVVAVDISKASKDGKDFIAFKRRVTKKMVEAESETGSCSLPFEKRQDLIDALSKAKLEMSRTGATAGDSDDTLFDDPSLKLNLVRTNRKQRLVVEFVESTVTFDLEPVHTAQFLDIIKRIK